jgi:hypothetical protein
MRVTFVNCSGIVGLRTFMPDSLTLTVKKDIRWLGC